MDKNTGKQWSQSCPHQVTNTLDAFLATDAQPQAYLFISRDSGLELAETFASKITQQHLPHADIVNFDAATADGIDGVRDMLRLASLLPVTTDRKVVLMQNMQVASAQMMNALLKTLEEPPSHTVFILLSSRPLLSTIMSRCQVFVLPHQTFMEGTSEELTEAMNLLQKHTTAGTAERMALVNTLANLDDELLPQVVEQWMYRLVEGLRTTPEKVTAARNSMETLQALRGNFNKKMVLQSFVVNSLV
jgi:hypothetical protein